MSGWDEALKVSRELTGKALPLARLLADAIDYAQNGTPVTASQAHATASKFDELKDVPGFAETWLVDGKPPQVGSRFYTSPPWPRRDAPGGRRSGQLLPRPAGGRDGARHGDAGPARDAGRLTRTLPGEPRR